MSSFPPTSFSKTGGPAFPPFPSDEGKYGLSLLDYFAAKAIVGILASEGVGGVPGKYAAFAYDIAIAMVEHRDRLTIEPMPLPESVKEEMRSIPPNEVRVRL